MPGKGKIEIDKKYLTTQYIKKSKSVKEIAEELGVHPNTVTRRIKEYGINKPSSLILTTQNLSPLEQELVEQIKKQKLEPEDVGKVLKNLKSIKPRKYMPHKIDFNEKRLRYGYISDAHMGHKCYRQDVMDDAAARFKKEKVEFVVNPGDTVEGMSNRDGHIYELDHIGMAAQYKFFKQEMEKLGDLEVLSIEAQDSHGGWGHSKANQGTDIGEELSLRAPNYKFMGYNYQTIELDNGLKIALRHPGGGTAYALSYKAQKFIESIGGGDKPNILHTGHFHKYNKIFYRNIHSIDSATLEDQSPFMQKIGTPAHVGFGIVDVYMKKDGSGIEQLVEKFFPYYD